MKEDRGTGRPPATPPDLAAIRAAAARITPHVHRTPVATSRTFDERFGASLFFKCENLQRVGAFKFRGAANAVFSLSDAEAARGVATHSSGNHAQALALAARLRGIPAHIVMPDNSPAVKVEAVRGYGGRVVFCEPTQAAREKTLAAVVAETGACFVHPYDDPRVIAGQATCALELLEQAGPLDAILVPIGGGGLASGTLLACGFTSPATSVYAVEPKGADDAFRSVRDGRIHPSTDPRTVADGLRTSLGTITFPIVKALVRQVVTVEEASIVAAMRLVWERMKLVVEPSGAVPLAALLEGAVDLKGKRVGIILSGGNVDLGSLPWSR